jgi:hypothetical protein
MASSSDDDGGSPTEEAAWGGSRRGQQQHQPPATGGRGAEVQRYIAIARQRVEAANVMSEVRQAQARRVGTLQIPVPDGDFDDVDFEAPAPELAAGQQDGGRATSTGLIPPMPPPSPTGREGGGCASDAWEATALSSYPPVPAHEAGGSTTLSQAPQASTTSLTPEPEPQLDLLQGQLTWDAQLRMGGVGRVDPDDLVTTPPVIGC